MHRRWLALAAVLCLLLVAVSLLASGRPGRLRSVVERDGTRVLYHRKLGFISTTRTESDPSIRVSDDLRKRLASLGLKLSPELARDLPQATRSRQPGILQDFYNLSGHTSGTLKGAVDFYARQTKGLRRYSMGSNEQLRGTLPDGHTQFEVMAYDDGGRTRIDLGLIVTR